MSDTDKYQKSRCGNKMRHFNYLEALQSAASLRLHSSDRKALLCVYPCEFCGFIHLGFSRLFAPKTRYLRELGERLRNPKFISYAPKEVVVRSQRTYRIKRSEIIEYCTAIILQGLRLPVQIDLSFLEKGDRL